MNRRVFDGIIIVGLLLHLAVGIPRMVARRWVREESGLRNVAGSAIVQATS